MYSYDSSREYGYSGCMVSCRNSIPFANDSVKAALGGQDINDDFGNRVGIFFQAPCSSVKRAIGPASIGLPVGVTENLPLAMYDQQGEEFLGYLTFDGAEDIDDCDCERCEYDRHWQDPHVSYSGCRGECSDQKKQIFSCTKDLYDQNGYPTQDNYRREGDKRWIMNNRLPESIQIAQFPYGFIGKSAPYGKAGSLTTFYNTPYRLYTSTYFATCPFKLISRRQSNFSNEPTNRSVTCLYQEGKNNDSTKEYSCSSEDSGWVFIPMDGSNRVEGQNIRSIYRDEKFYIVTYPYVEGSSNFLRWNCNEGNFDVVRRDSATLFSFPSSPIGKLYGSGCLFTPSNYRGKTRQETSHERLIPLNLSSSSSPSQSMEKYIEGMKDRDADNSFMDQQRVEQKVEQQMEQRIEQQMEQKVDPYRIKNGQNKIPPSIIQQSNSNNVRNSIYQNQGNQSSAYLYSDQNQNQNQHKNQNQDQMSQQYTQQHNLSKPMGEYNRQPYAQQGSGQQTPSNVFFFVDGQPHQGGNPYPPTYSPIGQYSGHSQTPSHGNVGTAVTANAAYNAGKSAEARKIWAWVIAIVIVALILALIAWGLNKAKESGSFSKGNSVSSAR